MNKAKKAKVVRSKSDPYLLGRNRDEVERLRRQVHELHGESRWLLDRISIPRGSKVIDLGCGPQGIVDLLSEYVGPLGSVVGLEKSDDFVVTAKQFVKEKGLANVKILRADAKSTGLPRESFDLAHARLVLVNVPEPERIVEEMVGLVRPGGVVASHEADYLPHLCDPPSAAWNRPFEIYEAYSRTNGIDLFVGRKTHRMFHAAGVVDIQVNPVVHVYPHGHNRRTIFWDFINDVRDRVLAHGLVDERELSSLMHDLKRHLDDPRTLVVSHLFFQVWGRKPDRSSVTTK